MSEEEESAPRSPNEETGAPGFEDRHDPRSREYEVGYGKPPVRTRFTENHKRGGRPRGSKNTRTLMMAAWNEKHAVQGRRSRLSTKEIAARRLAKRAAEGDLKAFEKFERLEAEQADSPAARQAGSRFEDPADALTMGDIIQRVRNMPLEEPAGPVQLEQRGADSNFFDLEERGKGDSPVDEEKDLS